MTFYEWEKFPQTTKFIELNRAIFNIARNYEKIKIFCNFHLAREVRRKNFLWHFPSRRASLQEKGCFAFVALLWHLTEQQNFLRRCRRRGNIHSPTSDVFYIEKVLHERGVRKKRELKFLRTRVMKVLTLQQMECFWLLAGNVKRCFHIAELTWAFEILSKPQYECLKTAIFNFQTIF